MKNELVVKSNQVIEASYRLSVIEQRVVLSAIAKIPKMCEVSDDEIYTVSVQDLKALGIHEKTAYRDLKEAVSRLYERSINLQIDGKLIKIRWVQRVDFLDYQGAVSLRFSKDILPFISNVKANFTQYMLSEVAKMQGAYSVRLYELLVQYKTMGERFLSIDDFRFMLDLGTRYKQFNDLLKRVIEPSVQEINAQTDLKIIARPQKTGRKFTHIKFTIKQKPTKLKILEDINKLSQKQIDFFANKLAYDDAFASQYAEVGEQYSDLENRLAIELSDEKFVQKILKDLKRLGFNSK